MWNGNLCPCSTQALQREKFSAHGFIKDKESHYGKTSFLHFLQKLWVASHCSIVTHSKTFKELFPHLLKFSIPSNLQPYKQKCKSFLQHKPPKAKWLQFIPEGQIVNYPIRSVQVLQQSSESSVEKIQTSVIKKVAKVFEQEHNHSTRKQILFLTYNRLFFMNCHKVTTRVGLTSNIQLWHADVSQLKKKRVKRSTENIHKAFAAV